jgi:glycosyltransferase involved in cell wall biosynthesis
MKIDCTFNPKVSIVIPVYNGSSYLKRSIESALNQTYKNIEIIVVNDGSNDLGKTKLIAAAFENQIIFIDNEVNKGTSHALNTGIKVMTGEYFCWLSHDDGYDPLFVETLIHALNKISNKETIMYTDLREIDLDNQVSVENTYFERDLQDWPSRKDSRIFPVLFMRLHGCQIMFPKSVFNKVGFFNEDFRVAQDYEFFVRAFLSFPHLLIPEVLGFSQDSINRQGRRLKALGTEEYSKVFINLLELIDEDEIKKLSPSTLELYEHLSMIYESNDYFDAYNYVKEKLFPIVHINYSDLLGREFNGYGLSFELRKIGVKSSQIVWDKRSDTPWVRSIRDSHENLRFYNSIIEFENEFSRKSIFSPYMDDILHDETFLDAELINLHILNHPAFNLNAIPLITSLKPTVWTIHDPWLLTGHCIHPNDCLNWAIQCRNCPDLETVYKVRFDNTALSFESKRIILSQSKFNIIVASDWMKKRIENSPLFIDKKIMKIPFGVNQKVFYPNNSSKFRHTNGILDSDVVLFARSSGDFKGSKYLVDTANLLTKDRSVNLVTVGEIDQLKGLSNKVNLIELGWVNDPFTLADIYRASDLFLAPSTSESFGLMSAEAMSCGTLVIALDTPNSALSETINSRDCGLIFHEKDFAVGVRSILDNKHELRKRRSNSLKFAQREYNYEVFMERTTNFYKETAQDFKLSENFRELFNQLKINSKVYRQNALPLVTSAPSALTSFTNRQKLRNSMIQNGLVIIFLKLLIKFLTSVRNIGLKRTLIKTIIYFVDMFKGRAL